MFLNFAYFQLRASYRHVSYKKHVLSTTVVLNVGLIEPRGLGEPASQVRRFGSPHLYDSCEIHVVFALFFEHSCSASKKVKNHWSTTSTLMSRYRLMTITVGRMAKVIFVRPPPLRVAKIRLYLALNVLCCKTTISPHNSRSLLFRH